MPEFGQLMRPVYAALREEVSRAMEEKLDGRRRAMTDAVHASIWKRSTG